MKTYLPISTTSFLFLFVFVFIFFVVDSNNGVLGFSSRDHQLEQPIVEKEKNQSSRRNWLQQQFTGAAGVAASAATAAVITTTNPSIAFAADVADGGETTATAIATATATTSNSKSFAPGGTLVDYKVGTTVGNDGASTRRRSDNSNVVFSQDYYYKFGTAPQFIKEGEIDFPKTMPFTLSQQRYDTMKKYRERVQRGIDIIQYDIKESIDKDDWSNIPDGDAPEYSIRPMGLMANGFLASENSGTTNELLLARWYINEIYLDVIDIKSSSSKSNALIAYDSTIKAMNSYLNLLNRVIIPKVGDPFQLL
jgi:hypothetical protein